MLSTAQTSVREQSDANEARYLRLMKLLQQLDSKLEDLRTSLTSRRKDNYTVDEFGEAVGRSAYTIRRWVAEKKIRAIRVQGTGPRGRLLIPRSELETLIESGSGGEIPETLLS